MICLLAGAAVFLFIIWPLFQRDERCPGCQAHGTDCIGVCDEHDGVL